jgi:hypothetical protein
MNISPSEPVFDSLLRRAKPMCEFENRAPVDQQTHPALILLAAASGSFARHGSVDANCRRRVDAHLHSLGLRLKGSEVRGWRTSPLTSLARLARTGQAAAASLRIPPFRPPNARQFRFALKRRIAQRVSRTRPRIPKLPQPGSRQSSTPAQGKSQDPCDSSFVYKNAKGCEKPKKLTPTNAVARVNTPFRP